MQFLANENVPLDVVEALRDEGHDVAWIRTRLARWQARTRTFSSELLLMAASY